MKLLISIIIFVAFALISEADKNSVNPTDNIAYFTANENFALGDNYLLDIDRDGITDFSFTTASIYKEGAIHNQYFVHAYQNHEILNAAEHTAFLETNEAITGNADASVTWTSGAGQIIEQVITNDGNEWFGTWSGGRAQYAGIKLVKDGHHYYGWVSISIDPATVQAYVKDYAINKVPEQPILAGQH